MTHKQHLEAKKVIMDYEHNHEKTQLWGMFLCLATIIPFFTLISNTLIPIVKGLSSLSLLNAGEALLVALLTITIIIITIPIFSFALLPLVRKPSERSRKMLTKLNSFPIDENETDLEKELWPLEEFKPLFK